MTDQVPACRGTDTEVFYDAYRWADAAKMCGRCPMAVKLQCRTDFASDPYAYAGGMTPAKRLAWRQRTARVEVQRGATETRKRPPKKTGRTNAKITPEVVASILAIFDAELIGTKGIADRVDLAKSTVQRVLRANGRVRSPEEQFELSRLGGLSGGQAELGERNRRMVMKLLGENYTPKEVAEMVGLNRTTVYSIRRQAREQEA